MVGDDNGQLAYRVLVGVSFEPVNKKRDSLLDFDGGIIPKPFPRFRNIGTGERDITGLRGLPVEDRLFAQGLLEQLDQPAQFYCLRLAQIENFIPEFALRASHNTLENIADVSVIASRRTVAENRDVFPGADQGCKLTNGEVRPLAWTVNREEPKHH